jgi:hypothetical protein
VQKRLRAVGLTPSRLLVIAAGFISVYFGFSIVGNRFHQYQLDRERVQLEARIAVERDRQARLGALSDWMQTDDFVEAMARREGMIRPGDHPIVVAAPSATPAAGAAHEWWEKYLEP